MGTAEPTIINFLEKNEGNNQDTSPGDTLQEYHIADEELTSKIPSSALFDFSILQFVVFMLQDMRSAVLFARKHCSSSPAKKPLTLNFKFYSRAHNHVRPMKPHEKTVQTIVGQKNSPEGHSLPFWGHPHVAAYSREDAMAYGSVGKP